MAREYKCVDGDAGPGIDPGAGLVGGPVHQSQVEEVAGRLLCAEEEWAAGHRACLGVDAEFAHELAQVQFAMGAVRLSWRKKHGM